MTKSKRQPDAAFAVRRLLNQAGSKKYPSLEAMVQAIQEMQANGVDVVPHLVRALNGSGSDDHYTVLHLLMHLDAQCPIESLLPLLDHPHYPVRLAALQVLAQQRTPKIIEPLIMMINDEDSLVREEAIRVLHGLYDQRAFGPFLFALEDPEWDVRSAAAEALGALGDTRAVEPLIKLLEDEAPQVRASAAQALGELGDKRALFALSWVVQQDRAPKGGWADPRGHAARAIKKIRGPQEPAEEVEEDE